MLLIDIVKKFQKIPTPELRPDSAERVLALIRPSATFSRPADGRRG
jgi:hypothetical protein